MLHSLWFIPIFFFFFFQIHKLVGSLSGSSSTFCLRALSALTVPALSSQAPPYLPGPRTLFQPPGLSAPPPAWPQQDQSEPPRSLALPAAVGTNQARPTRVPISQPSLNLSLSPGGCQMPGTGDEVESTS